MISVTINGKKIETEKGRILLDVARENGFDIPALCAHKELSPYGACRICLVEITGGARPGIQTSCLYHVTDGLEVKLDTERVVRARKVMFELLLARSQSPKIKELAGKWGVETSRIPPRGGENCILCGLCVRACAEVSQRFAISFSHRGMERRVQTAYDRISQTCIGCKACAYVCPTEAITIDNAE